VRKRRALPLIPLAPVALGGIAAAALWVRKVVLPARPDDAATARPRRIPDADARPSPDGAGVRLAVNPDSGPMWRGNPIDALRQALPAADLHELGPDDDLVKVLSDGLDDSVVAVGAAGGDGTLSAAATVATEHDLVLVAVPSGTFNHLARDLGLDSPEDTVDAIRAGTAIHMDLGVVTPTDGAAGEGERTFVNTLSFGGYTQVVDARERLQPKIGKWAALAVALARELPRMEPLLLELDGRPTTVWFGWIGNGAYAPAGFAPSWREQLDDGVLDVRLVLGDRRLARTRLVVEVLAGRLRRCPVYREQRVESLDVVSRRGPLRLAVDGETFDGAPRFAVTKRRRALAVAVPP
jgi:diacylglycerol kinase family enzyme